MFTFPFTTCEKPLSSRKAWWIPQQIFSFAVNVIAVACLVLSAVFLVQDKFWGARVFLISVALFEGLRNSSSRYRWIRGEESTISASKLRTTALSKHLLDPGGSTTSKKRKIVFAADSHTLHIREFLSMLYTISVAKMRTSPPVLLPCSNGIESKCVLRSGS